MGSRIERKYSYDHLSQQVFGWHMVFIWFSVKLFSQVVFILNSIIAQVQRVKIEIEAKVLEVSFYSSNKIFFVLPHLTMVK